MMTVQDIVNENKRRLEEINTPYNPITGQGSISVKRIKVEISDCPIGVMWLPEDFFNTGFIQRLVCTGFKGFIQLQCKQGPSSFIMNELWKEFCKERIKYDFEFWAYTSYLISQKGGGRDVPFLLNRAQRHFLKELETLRIASKPIDIILLKARQWGGSTLTQLYMLWIQLVHRRNWNSVICGHVESASRTVSGMLSKAIKAIPAYIFGTAVSSSPFEGSTKTRVLNVSQSRYSIGSAEKPDGIRSEDISMAHLTEVGLWKATDSKKPEDLVQSIFGSILSGPYTVKVLESTAKGVGNYFHRTWLGAVDGKNNFHPVFIPWFLIDIYSTPLERNGTYAFAKSLTEHELWLFELGATLEAINWYRGKQKEIVDKWRLCSEYPSTAQEAFQSTGNRVFEMKYVENLRSTCIDPCMYGEFVADRVKGKAAFSNLRFEQRDPTPDYENILWVWALPDYTSEHYRDRYIVSVDVGGTGEKADYSDISVIDRLPMLENGGVPEVVAEWHGHIEHDLLAWKAAQIARAYDNALLVIESNTLETEGTEGDHFEYILDEIATEYTNLYSRTTPEQIRQGMPTKYGFHTNTKTKPMLIDHLTACMRDCLYIERCKPTTYEMDVFERKEDGKTTGAVEGCHDDRVMGRAIGVYVAYDWPLPYRAQKLTARQKAKTSIVSEASI